MGYLMFIILVLSSFVMANEIPQESVGTVTILNAKPPQYDKTKKIIPGSQNSVLKVKQVVQDPKTGSVSLVVLNNNEYDVVLVTFKDIRQKDINSYKLKNYLNENPGFKIYLNPADLQFDVSRFVSILQVDGNNMKVRSDADSNVAVNLTDECSKSNYMAWLPWIADPKSKEGCR